MLQERERGMRQRKKVQESVCVCMRLRCEGGEKNVRDERERNIYTKRERDSEGNS